MSGHMRRSRFLLHKTKIKKKESNVGIYLHNKRKAMSSNSIDKSKRKSTAPYATHGPLTLILL